jgi:hypothetical protein
MIIIAMQITGLFRELDLELKTNRADTINQIPRKGMLAGWLLISRFE